MDISVPELISEWDFSVNWGVYTRDNGDLFSFRDAQNRPINHVWTVMDSGGEHPDHWIAAPGFHVVNALGYVLTRRPWDDKTPDACYFFDDLDDPTD